MATITDAGDARALLERALALTAKPSLATSDVDLLLRLAESVDATTGAIVYEASALNASAATGWQWKAGLTSDQYDLGGGAGVTLDRSQWHAHCRAMAALYGGGEMSVDGRGRGSRAGIGSIGLTSQVAAASAALYPEG